jgi:hypothetical protein
MGNRCFQQEKGKTRILRVLLGPEIALKLVLGGVSWFVLLGQRQACAGERLFYEWFVMVLCVVFGS